MIPEATLSGLLASATDESLESRHHGERHWQQVAQVGWYLAEDDPRVDPLVVFLFAILHDTQRLHDGRDPEHGQRAAEVMPSLVAADPFLSSLLLRADGVPTQRFRDLRSALANHHGGPPTSNPTVGACQDADRLTLWRCWMTPSNLHLSTRLAQSHYVKRWSRQLSLTGTVPTLSWDTLRKAYGLIQRSESIAA